MGKVVPLRKHEDREDIPILELQLSQLHPLETYSRTALTKRGIPEDVLDRSFPLYEFSQDDTRYFGASIIGQALNQYDGLSGNLDTKLSISDIKSLERLGGVYLDSKIVKERVEALKQEGRIPSVSGISMRFLNPILWDVLYANFGQASSQRVGIEYKKEDSKREEAQVPSEPYYQITPEEFILKVRYRHPNAEEVIKQAHREFLKKLDNNLALFARFFGIGRATAYRKFKEFGISRDLSELEGVPQIKGKQEHHDPAETILRIYYRNNSTKDLVRVAHEGFLVQNKGGICRVSELLNVSRATCHRNLKTFGITSGEIKSRALRGEEDEKSSIGSVVEDPFIPLEYILGGSNLDPNFDVGDFVLRAVQHTGKTYGEIRRLLFCGKTEEQTYQEKPLKQIVAEGGGETENTNRSNKKIRNKHLEDVDLETLGLKLVKKSAYSIARRVPSYIDVDDLISEGWVGFEDSIRRYNPDLNDNFGAYAKVRIDGAIKDYLRKIDNVSRSTRSKKKAVDEIRKKMLSSGLDASDEEVAVVAGLSLDKISEIETLVNASNQLSLEELTEKEFQDITGEQFDPLVKIKDSKNKSLLKDALRKLSRRTREIILLYTIEGLKMREIGKIFGITESRVYQIYQSGLENLRSKLQIHDFEFT
ncbi:MAG TPA: sigma-70 family RNA polymerase sigma factor [Candidatus Nanoarchaeia archaeon]|nr:sigma-70 family RNA polymerase sigma factor [Candidatus Nanoarchaeia archaeon]